jgi:MFS family permease
MDEAIDDPNDEAGRRGVFPAYVLLFATLYAGLGVMSPFLPALLQARGLRPEDIGLALALSTIVRFVTGPVAGRVADRLGALRSVFAASATAAALCGLGFLFEALGTTVPIIDPSSLVASSCVRKAASSGFREAGWCVRQVRASPRQ